MSFKSTLQSKAWLAERLTSIIDTATGEKSMEVMDVSDVLRGLAHDIDPITVKRPDVEAE